MKTKVKLAPASSIKANLGLESNGKVQKYFTNMCYRRMGQFVPGGSSSELNKNVVLNTNSITYKSPYAHYQYQSVLYVDPETGSSWARKGVTKVPTSKDLRHTIGVKHWDKAMWSLQKEDAMKEIQQFFNRG